VFAAKKLHGAAAKPGYNHQEWASGNCAKSTDSDGVNGTFKWSFPDQTLTGHTIVVAIDEVDIGGARTACPVKVRLGLDLSIERVAFAVRLSGSRRPILASHQHQSKEERWDPRSLHNDMCPEWKDR
jgi:hypothetical protein